MKTPDYSKYIKNSFDIALKNKWLWIFGVLVGAGGAPNVSSISDSIKSLNNTQQKPLNNLLSNIPHTTSNVLGTATTALRDWFSQVPTAKWVFFTLLVISIVILGITIGLVIRNWARASLIKGIDKAQGGKSVTLENTSPDGFKRLKKLVLLSLLLTGVIIGLDIPIVLLLLLIYVILSQFLVLKILWIIFGFLIFALIAVISFLLMTLVNAYAERLIVLKDYGVKKAFQKAILISRNTILASFLTGLVNFVFKIFAGIASLILLAISVGPSSYMASNLWRTNPITSIILVIFTAMSFLIFIFFSTIISAVMNVFSYSNWNQLFDEYMKSNPD